MTIIEGIALMQRILSSAKEEAAALNTVESAGVRGKLEVLEGEMNIFRAGCEELFGISNAMDTSAFVEEQPENANQEENADFNNSEISEDK